MVKRLGKSSLPQARQQPRQEIAESRMYITSILVTLRISVRLYFHDRRNNQNGSIDFRIIRRSDEIKSAGRARSTFGGGPKGAGRPERPFRGIAEEAADSARAAAHTRIGIST
jgi:hypothetical protein